MADSLKSQSNPHVHAQPVINPDGSDINSKYAGFAVPSYDYTGLTEATTTDTWVFKTGGAGGTTVATITINYTDSSKATIDNVVRT
jgi:hypothetical protein